MGVTLANYFATRKQKLLPPRPLAQPGLALGLGLVLLDGEPLHIVWRIIAAALEGRDVVDLMARARTTRPAGDRTRIGALELSAGSAGSSFRQAGKKQGRGKRGDCTTPSQPLHSSS